MRKLHLQFKRATQHFAKMGEESLSLPAGGAVSLCVCMYMSLKHTAVGG